MTQRIAKYEVLEKIAEGGFGTVYKARDPFIKRLVAIKTCSVADQEMARRFFREAEIAGRFDHPNVTIVHDFGVEGELAYLVQEYLSGEDLLQKIRRKDPLSVLQKVQYLLQVASGLAYAHSKQVIHRDIKPANLRVLESGQVKILDFGIAKLVSGATQLTQKGVAVGTLGYLSPEQLRDAELDTRTDIFSFGVVAYELLAYQKPFLGKQLSVLMNEILHQQPQALGELVPDLPPALEQVVMRCLEKDRDRRYQSFEEVERDLEAVRRDLGGDATGSGKHGLGVPSPPAAAAAAQPSTPPRLPAAAAGAAASPDEELAPSTRPIQLPAAEPLDRESATELAPSVNLAALAAEIEQEIDSEDTPRRGTPLPPPEPPRAAATELMAASPLSSLRPAATTPLPTAPAGATELMATAPAAPAMVAGASPLGPLPSSPPASPPAVPPPGAPVADVLPPLPELPPLPPPGAVPASPAAQTGKDKSKDKGKDKSKGPGKADLKPAAPRTEPLSGAALIQAVAASTGVAPAAGAPVAQAPRKAATGPGAKVLVAIAAGVFLLVVLGIGAWWLLSHRTAVPPPAAATASPPPTTAAAAAPTTLVVLGSPWGEVVRVQGGDGREVPLPARRDTPMVLSVPAGHYEVTLTNPAAPAPVTCAVDAVAGQPATCKAQLVTVDTLQYFKDAGWWR